MLHLAQSTETFEFNAAAEANHRIANHLAMIAGLVRLQHRRLLQQAEELTAEDLSAVLRGLEGKIDAVGNLHRRLAEPVANGKIDLADYLNEIVSSIVSALSIGGVTKLRMNLAASCHVDAKQAFNIALIVSEVVTNSMKYAHPAGVDGILFISCRRDAGTLLVEIQDDGVGLPDGFDPARDGHLGFRSIRSLAAQLDATIAYGGDGLGTSFELRVPAEAHTHGPEPRVLQVASSS